MGRSVQEPPAPPRDAAPDLWRSPPLALAPSGPQPRPQASLGSPRTHTAASAPARVRASGSARRAHSRSSLAPATGLSPALHPHLSPLNCVASTARPAPKRVGACAQGPYSVTPERQLRFPTASQEFFSSEIEPGKSNIFKGTSFFTPLLTGAHIELLRRRRAAERERGNVVCGSAFPYPGAW